MTIMLSFTFPLKNRCQSILCLLNSNKITEDNFNFLTLCLLIYFNDVCAR